MVSSVKFSFCILACLCALYSTVGQVVLPGSCPAVQVVSKFDAAAYMGTWYEVAKYPAPFEAGGQCVTAQYKLLQNGTVEVTNTLYLPGTNERVAIQGSAVLVADGKLLVKFDIPGAPTSAAPESNYWVLYTDYTNISVVFSCAASNSGHSEIVWILSRSRVPSIADFLTAVRVISDNGLSLNYLTTTNQEGCPC